MNSTIRVELLDVLPSNLRNSLDYVQTRVSADLDRASLLLFLKSYGYLMYNRDEKLSRLEFARDSDDVFFIECISALNECRDIGTFRKIVREQLCVVEKILTSSYDELRNLSKIESSGSFESESDSSGGSRSNSSDLKTSDYNELLSSSLDYLSKIVELLENEENHFINSMRLNEFAHNFLRDDHERNQRDASQNWKFSGNSDISEFLSVVFRDMFLSTGLQTHVMFLFAIKTTIVMVFLIVNFARNPTASISRRDLSVGANVGPVADDDDKMDVDEEEDFEPTERRCTGETRTDDLLNSMFDDSERSTCVLTIDNFVATSIVFVTREAFANFIDWPSKIREMDGKTINLTAIRQTLIKQLANTRRYVSLKWIRSLNGGLYINESHLLGFFEELAQGYNAGQRHKGKVAMRCTKDRNVVKGDCESAKNSVATGARYPLGPDYRSPHAPAWVALSSEVGKKLENFKSLSSQCWEIVAENIETSISQNWPREKISKNDELATELNNMTLFAILAGLKRGGNDRDNSVPYLIDTRTFGNDILLPRVDEALTNKDSSYQALLLSASYALATQSKISLKQMVKFVDCMVELWNTKIGICDINHVTLILARLMQIFPTMRSASRDNSKTSTRNDEN